MEHSKDPKNVTAFKMTGDWKEQSKQLKSKYPQLTDQDLKYEEGKTSELLSRIEKRLNKKYDEVVNIIRKGQPEKIA
jgi:uncharacterized protein YjbJ (UPF0337 family)